MRDTCSSTVIGAAWPRSKPVATPCPPSSTTRIMADDGDLDAMVTENLGRQDLSDLAEADLFARYSEIGLSQRAIAERLGIDQATVSRRLALLLLAPEVRRAVDDGRASQRRGGRSGGRAALRAASRAGRRRRIPTRTPTNGGPNKSRPCGWSWNTNGRPPGGRASQSPSATRAPRPHELGIPIVEDLRAELGRELHQIAASAATTTPPTPRSSVPSTRPPVSSTSTPAPRPPTLPATAKRHRRRHRPGGCPPAIATPRRRRTEPDAPLRVNRAGKQNRSTATTSPPRSSRSSAPTRRPQPARRLIGGKRARR